MDIALLAANRTDAFSGTKAGWSVESAAANALSTEDAGERRLCGCGYFGSATRHDWMAVVQTTALTLNGWVPPLPAAALAHQVPMRVLVDDADHTT
jgi:hypothetical protein